MYILDCEENASLYYGFKKDVTKEEYKNAIENNTLTDILNKIPVHNIKRKKLTVCSGTAPNHHFNMSGASNIRGSDMSSIR